MNALQETLGALLIYFMFMFFGLGTTSEGLTIMMLAAIYWRMDVSQGEKE